MREILFRGFHADENGEERITLNGNVIKGKWVEGYYSEFPVGSLAATIMTNDDEIVCEDTASYIITISVKQHGNFSNAFPLRVVECEKFEVLAETVGQFTGLTDTNGKRIFEVNE